MQPQDVRVAIPGQLADLLGPDPELAVRATLLLQLVHDRRVTLGFAAGLLGLDEIEATRWYTSHGYTYPRLTRGDYEEGVDNALRVLRGQSHAR